LIHEKFKKMNIELLAIAFYVVVMLGIGYYVSLKIKTDDDYFLAGRSLGPWLATFSIFATWFGAESCIGTSGRVFREGFYGAHADPVGYSVCIFLMGLFFAKVLWNRKITTIPDLFHRRYSPGAEKMAALIMIPSSIVWAGAQIRAFGQIIHATSDVGVFIGVTTAALVVIIYTMGGGLLADAYTDLIQGIALIVGLIIMIIGMVIALGGVDSTLTTLSQQHEYLWRPEKLDFFARLEVLMVPILGSLMSQELVSRVVASRSSSIAYKSSMIAGLIYICVGSMPVLVGVLGHHFYPNATEADSIMPMMAKAQLPFILYVIFIGALVSAILSTVDSTLLAVSALVSHNLVMPVKPNLTEKQKIILARGGVFISGLIAYGIAFTSDSVTELVETASSLGGPTILVMTCFALFSTRGNAVSAYFAMTFSIVTWFLTHFVLESETPVLWTVLACFLSYVVTIPFTTMAEPTTLKSTP
jgi:SSS family solute:Na+ symporter